MARSLVTGGAGFLGRHLVANLVERGDRVRVLDPVHPSEPVEGAEYRIGSVTDPDTVWNAIRDMERVFHLAGSAELWSPDPARAHRVHLDGVRNVLECGGRAGVGRIVHTSTEAILRDFSASGISSASGVSPVLPAPRDVPRGYCRSKLAAEREALDAARRGLPVVVVSPAAPLGPGDHNLTPPSRMLLGFLNGRLPAYLNGWLSIVDVRDVADGHRAAAERGDPGRRYVLAGTNLRLGALLRRLEELTGLSMPRLRVPGPLALAVAAVSELAADHLTGRPPDATLAGVRISMATPGSDRHPGFSELEITPRSLDETLSAAVSWFAEEGLLERSPAPRPGAGVVSRGP